jgi:ParB family chromosome partitioning protein
VKNSKFSLAGRGILDGFTSEDSLEAGQPETQNSAAQWIAVHRIQPSQSQPRQFFAPEPIDRLVTSFQERGFYGAINVRPNGKGRYEIIAGERRWRAAKQAGLKEVRCIVQDCSDEEALEFALVENLLREDLSKLEETEGILSLIQQKFGIEKEDAIDIINKQGHPDQLGRSDVATSEELKQILSVLSHFGIELQTFRTKNIRTLSLPEELKVAHLKEGLSYSSALEIAKVKDKDERQALLKQALKKQMSFREIKEVVREKKDATRSPQEPSFSTRLTDLIKRTKRAESVSLETKHQRKIEKLLSQLEGLLSEIETEA